MIERRKFLAGLGAAVTAPAVASLIPIPVPSQLVIWPNLPVGMEILIKNMTDEMMRVAAIHPDAFGFILHANESVMGVRVVMPNEVYESQPLFWMKDPT